MAAWSRPALWTRGARRESGPGVVRVAAVGARRGCRPARPRGRTPAGGVRCRAAWIDAADFRRQRPRGARQGDRTAALRAWARGRRRRRCDTTRRQTSGAPSILRLPSSSPADDPRFLVVEGRKGRTVTFARARSPVARRSICASALRPFARRSKPRIWPRSRPSCEAASIRASRRAPVTRALLHAALRDREIDRCLAARRGSRRRVRDAAAATRCAAAGSDAARAARRRNSPVAGVVAGDRARRARRPDGRGWLTAWALLLATMLPLHVWTSWLQGRVALGAAKVFKERLLVGALRLEPDEIRGQGAGQLLGRVLESRCGRGACRGRRDPSRARGRGSADGRRRAVVGCGGHPARRVARGLLSGRGRAGLEVSLAQSAVVVDAPGDDARSRRTSGRSSDAAGAGGARALARGRGPRARGLSRPFAGARPAAAGVADRPASGLDACWPSRRSAPALLAGAAPPTLAVSVGGVLLAALALRRGGEGLAQLSGAAVAWRQAQPLFDAAARRPNPPAMRRPPAV